MRITMGALMRAYESPGENNIRGFYGPHRWLSNFWMAPFTLEGMEFPSVEHAYQAAKCEHERDFEYVMAAATAGGARARGRSVRIRRDWDKMKLDVMESLVRAKFEQNLSLAAQLLATGDLILIEDNHWGDTYWGMCRGVGENHLGKILMKVREELRAAQ